MDLNKSRNFGALQDASGAEGIRGEDVKRCMEKFLVRWPLGTETPVIRVSISRPRDHRSASIFLINNGLNRIATFMITIDYEHNHFLDTVITSTINCDHNSAALGEYAAQSDGAPNGPISVMSGLQESRPACRAFSEIDTQIVQTTLVATGIRNYPLFLGRAGALRRRRHCLPKTAQFNLFAPRESRLFVLGRCRSAGAS